jgi:hypothetical protein
MIAIADIDLIARNTYRFAYVEPLNGATGMSDMAGKVARVAVREMEIDRIQSLEDVEKVSS